MAQVLGSRLNDNTLINYRRSQRNSMTAKVQLLSLTVSRDGQAPFESLSPYFIQVRRHDGIYLEFVLPVHDSERLVDALRDLILWPTFSDLPPDSLNR